MAAFVLRAWRIATLPTLIYVLALWGVGLGGGNLLAFDLGGAVPPAWQAVLPPRLLELADAGRIRTLARRWTHDE